MKKAFVAVLFITLFSALPCFALGEAGEATVSHGPGITLFWIALILLAAKISGLVEKIGQPSVLGELLMGVALGNLSLLGINALDPIKTDPIIAFLAQLGVVILLFQIGLESNISKMRKVGLPAFLVAVVGVVLPFVLGTYLVGPWILPGLSDNAYLFLGATLTATSVGITARVFKDLGKLQTREAQIVLGAAVIDDVLGLIILAVVSAIASVGAASIGAISAITAQAIIFLVGAIVLGQLCAKQLGRFAARISNGTGMKFTFAIVFCLVLAYLAELIGLAPIIGAFAAGLVLDAVHFTPFSRPQVVDDVEKCIGECEPGLKSKIKAALEPFAHRHVEDLIEPIGHLLVPIFFVVTGMSVRLETLFDPKIILLALIITVVAFVGKIAAGLVAGKGADKLIVGVGMIPRGEVGLIFAAVGKSLGVVDDSVYSIIIIMVILSTLLTPPLLAWLIKRNSGMMRQEHSVVT